MAAVQAYLDHQRFGSLPRSGGTFDQPAELLEEMRLVADRVEAARAREREKERRKAERKKTRTRGSRGRR